MYMPLPIESLPRYMKLTDQEYQELIHPQQNFATDLETNIWHPQIAPMTPWHMWGGKEKQKWTEPWWSCNKGLRNHVLWPLLLWAQGGASLLDIFRDSTVTIFLPITRSRPSTIVSTLSSIRFKERYPASSTVSALSIEREFTSIFSETETSVSCNPNPEIPSPFESSIRKKSSDGQDSFWRSSVVVSILWSAINFCFETLWRMVWKEVDVSNVWASSLKLNPNPKLSDCSTAGAAESHVSSSSPSGASASYKNTGAVDAMLRTWSNTQKCWVQSFKLHRSGDHFM